MIFIPLYVVR